MLKQPKADPLIPGIRKDAAAYEMVVQLEGALSAVSKMCLRDGKMDNVFYDEFSALMGYLQKEAGRIAEHMDR